MQYQIGRKYYKDVNIAQTTPSLYVESIQCCQERLFLKQRKKHTITKFSY